MLVFKKKYLILFLFIICCSFVFVVPTKNIPNKIDNIYIISLPKAKKRLDKITKSLDENGLKYKIFEAIDGRKLKIKDQFGNTFTGEDLVKNKELLRFGQTYTIFCPKLSITYHYKTLDLDDPMLSGTMGCYCSHLEVMMEIVKNKENMSIVFEDDAFIPVDFAKNINDLKQSLVPDWDIMYLGFGDGVKEFKIHFMRVIKKFKLILFNTKINKLDKGITGTVSYATNYAGASKMISLLTNTDRQIDYLLFKYTSDNKINALFANNVDVHQDPLSVSNIAIINDSRKPLF